MAKLECAMFTVKEERRREARRKWTSSLGDREELSLSVGEVSSLSSFERSLMHLLMGNVTSQEGDTMEVGKRARAGARARAEDGGQGFPSRLTARKGRAVISFLTSPLIGYKAHRDLSKSNEVS